MIFKPRYNLVLVANPNMKVDDFKKIGRIAQSIDPYLKSIVLRPGVSVMEPLLEISKRPTLAFSPWNIPRGFIPRGKVYCGRTIPKTEQIKLLRQSGVSVPRTALVKPGSIFSEADWGSFAVVKPLSGSFSIGVQVKRPQDIRYELEKEERVGKYVSSDRIVQQFIDTGVYRSQIRVLTLFGEVLYAEEIKAAVPLAAPDEITPETLKDFVITPVTVERTRRFVYEDDVLSLASRVHRIFPDIPLQGIDIIREVDTGKLFVLEINAGGNTWHFSSRFGQYQRVEEKRRDEQFDAFRRAAEVLVEKTQTEAV